MIDHLVVKLVLLSFYFGGARLKTGGKQCPRQYFSSPMIRLI